MLLSSFWKKDKNNSKNLQICQDQLNFQELEELWRAFYADILWTVWATARINI